MTIIKSGQWKSLAKAYTYKKKPFEAGRILSFYLSFHITCVCIKISVVNSSFFVYFIMKLCTLISATVFPEQLY